MNKVLPFPKNLSKEPFGCQGILCAFGRTSLWIKAKMRSSINSRSCAMQAAKNTHMLGSYELVMSNGTCCWIPMPASDVRDKWYIMIYYDILWYIRIYSVYMEYGVVCFCVICWKVYALFASSNSPTGHSKFCTIKNNLHHDGTGPIGFPFEDLRFCFTVNWKHVCYYTWGSVIYVIDVIVSLPIVSLFF